MQAKRPFSQRPGLTTRFAKSAEQEDSFNEVMVQVFPAFILFLAWVMTGTVAKATALQQELDTKGRAMDQAIANIESELAADPSDRQTDYFSAKFKAQLEELLRIWARVAQDRPLAKLLNQFNQASNIALDTQGSCLPLRDAIDVDPADVPSNSVGIDPDEAEAVLRKGFWGLIEEAERVFPRAGHAVSNAEVMYWMEAVIYSKYPRDAEVYDPDLVDPKAQDFSFNPNFPTRPTVESLKKVIQADLAKERQKLARIQYRLVGNVCRAQYQRELNRPLQDFPASGSLPAAEPGSENTMVQVLEELEQSLYMLPEVRDQILRRRDESLQASSPVR